MKTCKNSSLFTKKSISRLISVLERSKCQKMKTNISSLLFTKNLFKVPRNVLPTYRHFPHFSKIDFKKKKFKNRAESMSFPIGNFQKSCRICPHPEFFYREILYREGKFSIRKIFFFKNEQNLCHSL